MPGNVMKKIWFEHWLSLRDKKIHHSFHSMVAKIFIKIVVLNTT